MEHIYQQFRRDDKSMFESLRSNGEGVVRNEVYPPAKPKKYEITFQVEVTALYIFFLKGK